MLSSEEIRKMSPDEVREYNARVTEQREAWERRKAQGYVYFLRSGNEVKIGFSTNLRQRLEKLRNGNAFPVFICKYVEGDRKTESRFHRQYAEYRVRGEWFELRGRLAKYLEMHVRPVDLPPPVPADEEPEFIYIL